MSTYVDNWWDQQHQIDGLRKASDRRSTLVRQVNPVTLSGATSIETPCASSDGLGL